MTLPVQPTTFDSRIQQLTYFVRLGRPLHLAGGFVFNGLGIVIAASLGASIIWTAVLLCQIAITATQLMTHYSNDYFDQDADSATDTPTRWSGGSRVLPDGLIDPRAALIMALVCGGLALGATAVLAVTGLANLTTVSLLIVSVILAWSYSSPPLWLNRRGLGEITGALLVPGLTTLLGFMVQTGQLDRLPLLAVVPLVCFQFAMLLAVNFPDVVGDKLVNKRTLVVVVGPARAAQAYVASLVLAYLLVPILVLAGLPLVVGLAIALLSPIALWQIWRIHRGAATDPSQWNALGFWSIGLLLGSALLEVAAFLYLTLT